MATLIETLKVRSQNCADNTYKFELKLYNLIDSLGGNVKEYLKRISVILPEFDLHDASHSQKVVENIEQLLGDVNLSNLSSYELFLLYISAYLHDCAMAPSDWEINLLKLTEGSDKYYECDYSIKHDLKKPLSIAQAEELVKESKPHLYDKYDNGIAEALFVQRTEEKLIEYLAVTLVEYQIFRNGYKDRLECIESKKNFEIVNQQIRTDFIRTTHHQRIEEYVKNLSDSFFVGCDKLSWARKLTNDLAKICRAHGEDIDYVRNLNSNESYHGSERANLQLVAMLLRLGDIIHFSYDRAPLSTRTSKLFQSDYSFQQWAIKSESGINYTIYGNKITYMAYCEKPETYFKLKSYLKWVEEEVINFNTFKFHIASNPVEFILDNNDISYDKEEYELKEGLSFSLSQEKIITLLMGVGLYKDKYACLRELYQNSLDACRCMLSQNEDKGLSTIGKIEFGISEKDGYRYLYCLDNGTGMSKDIIENYLLKIGNSYYKSTSFYKEQANWSRNFNPTSQFGIGILSCFMLGDKIDIITKHSDNDYVSCCVDGPFESMYYIKDIDPKDKELLKISGTLIKIRLTETIYDNHIDKLGLQLIYGEYPLKDILIDGNVWKNHIYNIINSYIVSIPCNIQLTVRTDAQKQLSVANKPYFFDEQSSEALIIKSEDYEHVDKYIDRFQENKFKFSDIAQLVKHYPISIIEDSCEYNSVITLPSSEDWLKYTSTDRLRNLPRITYAGICIDGIKVEGHISMFDYYNAGALNYNGYLNFSGSIRPRISVDRKSIVDFTNECEKVSEKIHSKYIDSVISIINIHIAKYNIEPLTPLYNVIWEIFFEKHKFSQTTFINKYANTEYGNVKLEYICNLTKSCISIKEFLFRNKAELYNYDFRVADALSRKMILNKIVNATNVLIDNNNNISIEFDVNNPVTCDLEDDLHKDFKILKRVDSWSSQYDILSNMYPFIPARLYDCIEEQEKDIIAKNTIKIHAHSNDTFCFFDQSPMLINKYGLYSKDSSMLRKRTNSSLFCFDNKKHSIYLSEINGWVSITNKKDNLYVLFVYIAPISLTDDDLTLLNGVEDTDPDYYKGVTEGWSILATGMDFDNVVVMPGVHDRQILVNELSSVFWNKYQEYSFKFLDGTAMLPLK